MVDVGKVIKIVTQNCFFGLPVVRVKKLVEEMGADVFCLQEVTSKWFANKVNRGVKNEMVMSRPVRALGLVKSRNVILTQLPVVDAGEIYFKKTRLRGYNPFAGKALWTEVMKEGRKVRIYNCYLQPFGMGMLERKKIMEELFWHAREFAGPVIICGDMNTMVPAKRPARIPVKWWCRFPYPKEETLGSYAKMNEKYFFRDTALQNGYREMADVKHITWRMPLIRWESLQLKLDWMLYRECEPVSYGFGPWIGDHRSIIGELRV